MCNSISFLPTLKIDERTNKKLHAFQLYQNDPNPFPSAATSRGSGNPVNTIQFAIPRKTKVEISIYTIAGQRIATFFDDTKTAGTHKLVWDASATPSRRYFIKMQAGEFVGTVKGVLVR